MGLTSWEEVRQLINCITSSSSPGTIQKSNLHWDPGGQEAKNSSYSQNKPHCKAIQCRAMVRYLFFLNRESEGFLRALFKHWGCGSEQGTHGLCPGSHQICVCPHYMSVPEVVKGCTHIGAAANILLQFSSFSLKSEGCKEKFCETM